MTGRFKEFYNAQVLKEELTRQQRINVLKNTDTLFRDSCKFQCAVISWIGHTRRPTELFVPYEQDEHTYPYTIEANFYSTKNEVCRIYSTEELSYNRGYSLLAAIRWSKRHPELLGHILYQTGKHTWCSTLTLKELLLKVDELFPYPF